MHLSCQKAFILVVALTTACNESTAPPISGAYVLESIDGQSLPANIQAGGGDTITVFWSTLSLDAAGNAELVEHIRYVHPNSPPGEGTYTTGYVYRVTGNRVIGHNVAFDYSPPCPPNALCVEPPVGKIVGNTLTLFYGSPAFRPPSFYRVVGPVLARTAASNGLASRTDGSISKPSASEAGSF